MPPTIPHEQMPILGKLIREHRIKKNMTQKELAEIIGVKESYISRLETGQHFQSIKCVIAIPLLEALNISLDEFKEVMFVKEYLKIKNDKKVSTIHDTLKVVRDMVDKDWYISKP